MVLSKQKLMKKFFRKGGGRDVGTLAYLKTVIHRSDVNGEVKQRYKSHEEFVLLVGKAIVIHAAMEHFGISAKDGQATRQDIPNMERTHKATRQQVFGRVMASFMESLVQPQTFQEVHKTSNC